MARLQLNDKWFRFASIPIIAFMGHIIFYNRNDSGDERFGFWTIYLLSLAETMLLWETNRLSILYYRRKYPQLSQTQKRVVSTLLTCILITIAVRTANIYLYDETMFWGYRFPFEAYLHSIAVALLFVVVVGGAYESIYYFRKWKDTAVEAESLKKENLQTQLDSLKAQLSPHFLFNSLGSLSSLIEEEPQKAQVFVEEMSTVYRYLLHANEKDLATLQEEMEFVDAYVNMLTTRFPGSLVVQVHIAENYLDYLLPPLTVQILVENAVKHNSALPSKPLQINISTDDVGNLVVDNNLQKKTSPVISSRKGLNNIISKYKLLNQPDIIINETGSHFRVLIPLIKTKTYAGLNS